MKLFLDTADLDEMTLECDGVTTNPSLLRAAGVTSYESFGRAASAYLKDRRLSLEVLTRDDREMIRQGLVLASWGSNIWVKVPVLKSVGGDNCAVIKALCTAGVKVNITAVLSQAQAELALSAIPAGAPAILSVFAGRISDLGHDVPWVVRHIVRVARNRNPQVEVLWASVRGIGALHEAERCEVDIVTVPPAILCRRRVLGMLPDDYTRETVARFEADAVAVGYSL